MGRFIIITFVVLGFAFYQLSGGSTFDPVETRNARIDGPVPVATAPLEDPEPDAPAAVTRVNLELAAVSDVFVPQRNERLRFEDAPQPVAGDGDAPLSLEVEERAPSVVLPSLIVNAVPEEATITPVDFASSSGAVAPLPVAEPVLDAEATGDIRAVNGTRVNVRGGPGTDFAVVNSLVRGDQVEVLEDPGTGWVRMRAVDGQTVGWIADFLLSEG